MVAKNASAVRIRFTLPQILIGLVGHAELHYTRDPTLPREQWGVQKFARPKRLFDTANIEYHLGRLIPDTVYYFQIRVVVEALQGGPESEVYRLKMPPLPSTTTTTTTTSTTLATSSVTPSTVRVLLTNNNSSQTTSAYGTRGTHRAMFDIVTPTPSPPTAVTTDDHDDDDADPRHNTVNYDSHMLSGGSSRRQVALPALFLFSIALTLLTHINLYSIVVF